MLNLAGPEAIKRSKNFDYASDESKEDPEILIKKFRDLCNPQTNVSMERHTFFNRDQLQDESIESYMTDLKNKTASCELDTLKDSLIHDRFISGVKSEQLRRVLLKERDLTLSRAVELAQLDEITQSRLKQFKSSPVSVEAVKQTTKRPPAEHFSKSFRHFQHDSSRPTENIRYKTQSNCSRCGYRHSPDSCPAKGKQCNASHKYNHYVTMCKSDKPQLQQVAIGQNTSKKTLP